MIVYVDIYLENVGGNFYLIIIVKEALRQVQGLIIITFHIADVIPYVGFKTNFDFQVYI